jgi:hypothetical protein
MVNFSDVSDIPIVKSLSIPDHLAPQPIHHMHFCWRCIYSYRGGWESGIQEGCLHESAHAKCAQCQKGKHGCEPVSAVVAAAVLRFNC